MQVVIAADERELIRAAARRSRAEADGGRRFARVTERALEGSAVRAVEAASGLAIAQHLTAVFGRWDGARESLEPALAAHFRAYGMELAFDESIDDIDDDIEDDFDSTGEHPHVRALRGRAARLVVAGIAGFVLASGAGLASALEGGLPAVLLGATACGLAAAGAVLVRGGRARRLRAEQLRDLEGLALARARIPLDALARELGVGPDVARSLVREALGHLIIEGRLDLEDGVFVSAITETRVRERPLRCRVCGGSSVLVRARGMLAKCPYCDAPLGE